MEKQAMKQSVLDMRMRRWEKTRQKGKLRFSLYSGLGFGVTFALVAPLANWFMQTANSGTSLTEQYLTVVTLFRILCFGFFTALLFYFYRWQQREKQYQEWLNEKK